MSQIFNLIESLFQNNFVSGNESTANFQTLPDVFMEYGGTLDDFGNIWIEKKSKNKKAKTILIEAHLDAIGLCVQEITENGFLSVCPCGGFDWNILPGTEFFVHSANSSYRAIATSIPPHLQNKDKSEEKLSADDLYLDCGFQSKEVAEKHIEIGSNVTFASACKKMLNGRISAPSLDNKAAVAALLLTCKRMRSDHNVYFLFSVGEETSSRGVKSALFPIKPDLAFVVDAGFALTKGLNPDQCILMDQGPSVSIADTLSRAVPEWILGVAEKQGLALQTVVEPGGTGTSATALQLRCGGIPCAVISIPLKYMHTPSEMVSESDIQKTAELLCALVEEQDFDFGEVTIVG